MDPGHCGGWRGSIGQAKPPEIAKGHKKRQKKKLAPRAIKGIWVGQVGRTGEHIVVKNNGDAIRCRTIRRLPIEDRWNATMIKDILATPRNRARGVDA